MTRPICPVNRRPIPSGVKNYMTPKATAACRTNCASYCGWNVRKWWSDRSENGDYICGKRRLREIDRRIRFLSKPLERAEVVDPNQQRKLD
jgi:transcription elongation factor GreB